MRSRPALLALLIILLLLGGTFAVLEWTGEDDATSWEDTHGERSDADSLPGLRGTSPPEDRLWKEPGEDEGEEGASDDAGAAGPRPVPPAMKTRGRVVGADGKPLPSARVFYRRRFGSDAVFERVGVDAEGRFEIPWLARGTSLIVHAAADETSFPLETVDGKGLVRAGAQDLVLSAGRGASLTVRVPMLQEPGFGVDADGIPVQIVQYGRETNVVLRTVLDAEGRATFSGLQPEKGSYIVHVGPDGTGRCARGAWTGGDGMLELAWKRAARILGRVTGPHTKPMRVDVRDPNGFVFHADVEQDGTFAVEGIETNLAWCMARARVIAHIHETPWVRCAPGDRDVELTFPPAR